VKKKVFAQGEQFIRDAGKSAEKREKERAEKVTSLEKLINEFREKLKELGTREKMLQESEGEWKKFKKKLP